MLLARFRVQNFRSVEDSGDIDVAKLTSLVGRNESGKSNLLLALSTLNPPGERLALAKIKDFPRSRRIEDCKPDTPVVWTWWRLERSETDELKRLLPDTPAIEEVASVAVTNRICGFASKQMSRDWMQKKSRERLGA